VDFAARRAQARKEMQPHLDETERIKAHLVMLKERLKAFKKDKAEISDIEALEQQIKEQEKAACDFQTKADAIDAAVFDLKAVNPNVVAKVDIRTPAEIIENIAAQGRIVSSALEKLKLLMTEPD
jgi:type I restriction enzyme M protein